jgi:hypothetical protein
LGCPLQGPRGSSYGEGVSEPVPDPEVVTRPTRSELEEAGVDETPDEERPQPIEADPADVADQRVEIHVDEDDLAEPDDEY